MALNLKTYRWLYSQYRKTVPHSSKGVPEVPFGRWLYEFGLFLLVVAPQYQIDRLPTEEQIQGFVLILRSYVLVIEE